jgi:glycosyltransferase involved in cell wall biosynthesis
MSDTSKTTITSTRPADARVSVVVPAMNEARNIPHVFAELPADLHEVILVDGRSTDGTVRVGRELRPDLVVVRQTRKGKGNALACGFGVATGDIIVMIDADGSTHPAEITRFVEALKNGADVAKGSRFCDGGGSDDITWARRQGNAALNTLANVIHRMSFSDLCYGYMAFWRDVMPRLDLPDVLAPAPADGSMAWGDGFEIETLLAVRSANAGLKIAEVPSHERPRLFGESNLNAISDGRRVLRTVLAERRRKPRPDHERSFVDLRAIAATCAQCFVPEPVCYCEASA